jgi:hypothetical protein
VRAPRFALALEFIPATQQVLAQLGCIVRRHDD